MVRGELPAFLGLREAAPAGGEDDRCGFNRVVPHARGPPGLELVQRAVRKGGDARALDRVAQRLRDRVPRAVADLEQPLPRRAPATREAVAPILARELDPEL